MNITQYNSLKNSLSDNIYGQKIGLVIVTQSGMSAPMARQGYRKVSRYNAPISKRSYLEVVNTSTGAKEVGAEFKQIGTPRYESEKLNGFFSHLISKPDKKYLRLCLDMEKSHVINSVYVQGTTIVADTFEDACKLGLFTNSYIKGRNQEYGREKVMKAADIHVKPLSIKIENIALIRVSGHEEIDPLLANYLAFAI